MSGFEAQFIYDERPDVTGTFELREVELPTRGFDPSATSDPVFHRDDERRACPPLDAHTRARITSGALRF